MFSLTYRAPAIGRKLLFLPLIIGMLIAGLSPLTATNASDDLQTGLLVPAFAAFLGLFHWLQTADSEIDNLDLAVVLGIGALFVIPSYQGGWILLFMLSVYLMLRQRDSIEGLQVLTLAALHQPIMTYALKLFTAPVLSMDAMMIAALLNVTTGAGSYAGNLVTGPADHQLLILKGCSSLSNLGIAWLAWFAISRYRGIKLNRNMWMTMLLITLLTLALNLTRLYGMALSIEWHEWWHSDAGETTYQMVLSGLLLFSILLGLKHESDR